jgi:general secretion pathway protein I
MQTCPPSKEAEAHEAGFTLIEVLVALAILALTLAVLFSVLSDGAGRAAHAEKQAKALLQAQSLLPPSDRRSPCSKVTPPGISMMGRAGSSGSRLTATCRPQGVAGRSLKVSVEVAWVRQPERSLTLTTLRLGAKESTR